MKSILSSFIVLLIVNAILSTVYFNFIDSGLGEIAQRFNSGEMGGLHCEGSSNDKDGHTIPAVCEGGVLSERDSYLEEHHVVGIGGWEIHSDGETKTFQTYFKYWL